MTQIIYFDAFYREQTGEIYTAIVSGEFNELIPEKIRGTSSGHAEWIAAMRALEYVEWLKFDYHSDRSLGPVKLIGDATVVTDQMEHPDRLKENEKKRNPLMVKFQKSAQLICDEIGGITWGRKDTTVNPAGKLIRKAQNNGMIPKLKRFPKSTGSASQ